MESNEMFYGNGEDFFRGMVEASQNYLIVMTPEMKIAYVNSAGARLYNKPATKIIGMHLDQLFPSETTSQQMESVRSVIETGQNLTVEACYPFPKGKRWLKSQLSPVHNSEGHITAALISSQDITEQKQSENALNEYRENLESCVECRTKELKESNDQLLHKIAQHKNTQEMLRQSNALFVALFQALPDLCVRVTSDGIVRNYFAGQSTDLYLEQKEFLGRSLVDVLPPEVAVRINIAIVQVLESRSLVSIEYSLVLPSGKKFFEGRVLPFIEDDILVVVRDITDRKRMELEWQKLAAVVHHSKELVNMSTLDGNMIFLNNAGGEILGIDPAKCESVNIMQVIPEHLVELVKSELLPTLMRGDIWEGDLQYRNLQTGSLTDVHATTFTVKNPETGEPWFLANVSLDITDRKKAEIERLEMEKKVQHSQKLESLGVLAGGIAHDFNNLLVSVLGNAELALLDLSPESPIRSYIEDIQTSSLRLSELTQQMLAYSGKGKNKVEKLNLTILVEEMVHLLEIAIPKKVELRLQLDHNLPAIRADASQIRQVIMNLITNAAEACGNQTAAISVSTGLIHIVRRTLADYYIFEDLAEGDYVFIEVMDSGCGMDKETCQKIFEPFFSTKFTGRGLGMASVLGIIRGHNGAIKVCSEPNQGTTIKVVFPHEEVECREVSEVSLSECNTFRRQGMVLLVDDEEEVLKVGKQMLEQIGFTVICAVDGYEAVDQIRKNANNIVCVLLDLTMPKMDGIEALSEIRRIRFDFPVILCSGYDQNETMSQVAGNDQHTGFLHKPFRYQSLVDKLREVMPLKPHAKTKG